MSGGAAFRIGLLGPARVGKTSLVTAMLSEAHHLLAGSGVAMRAVGRATEDRISNNRTDLESGILAGQFTPGSLKGTVEPFVFKLALDPGVPGAEITLELLDFPGGWITPRGRGSHSDEDWEWCRQFIMDSTVLLVPVDATLLMESFQQEHVRLLPHLLTTVPVEQIAREWAIERNRRSHEPALVVFCPVKCETYFHDNGGRQDKSAELRRKFDNVYSGVVEAIRADAPKAQMLYMPIDTIGCVELVTAEWSDDEGELRFKPLYRVRRNPKISRKGVDDLLTAITQQLIDGKRLIAEQESKQLHENANEAMAFANRHEGFFRNIWLMINGERALRRRAAEQASLEAHEALRRVNALDKVLTTIAERRYGPRVQKL
ncbi:MAG: hypothetical protein IRY84_06200 [Thermobispora bispora]|nr:hypothetical protein [Thermobispora bispora]